jgi:hypothetical protein
MVRPSGRCETAAELLEAGRQDLAHCSTGSRSHGEAATSHSGQEMLCASSAASPGSNLAGPVVGLVAVLMAAAHLPADGGKQAGPTRR